MNDRIKELAEQAGMTADKFGMFFAKDYDSHCADGVDLEKFAELIVQECSRLCYDNDFATGSGYGEAINKHFGVK